MRCIALLLAMALGAPLTAAVVAVHPEQLGVELTRERLSDLFLGRVSTWPDGRPVIIVLAEDAAADEALVAVVGRDRQRLLRGWKRLAFSGAGAMPRSSSSTREALALVARTPGALAIVDRADDPGVRVLPVALEAPSAPAPAPSASAPAMPDELRSQRPDPAAPLAWWAGCAPASHSACCQLSLSG